jgi:hypothetical protein
MFVKREEVTTVRKAQITVQTEILIRKLDGNQWLVGSIPVQLRLPETYFCRSVNDSTVPGSPDIIQYANDWAAKPAIKTDGRNTFRVSKTVATGVFIMLCPAGSTEISH